LPTFFFSVLEFFFHTPHLADKGCSTPGVPACRHRPRPAGEDGAASGSCEKSAAGFLLHHAEQDLLKTSRSHSEGARLDRGCSWFQDLSDGFKEASRKAAPPELPWDRTPRCSPQHSTLRDPQPRKLISPTSLRRDTRPGAGGEAVGLAWPSQCGLWLRHPEDAGRVLWARGQAGCAPISCTRGEPPGPPAQGSWSMPASPPEPSPRSAGQLRPGPLPGSPPPPLLFRPLPRAQVGGLHRLRVPGSQLGPQPGGPTHRGSLLFTQRVRKAMDVRMMVRRRTVEVTTVTSKPKASLVARACTRRSLKTTRRRSPSAYR